MHVTEIPSGAMHRFFERAVFGARDRVRARHARHELARRAPREQAVGEPGQEDARPDPPPRIVEGEDVKDPKYSEITKSADAFIIVTPEYNHSFPGSLKRMLDSEYENYFKKPVALVGVSNGSWGGVRVCEALLPVCHRLGLVTIHSELYFPKIQEKFNEDGSIKAEFQEQYDKNIQKMLDELMWFAKLLNQGG